MRAISLRSRLLTSKFALSSINVSRMWVETDASKSAENSEKKEGTEAPKESDDYSKLQQQLAKAQEEIVDLRKDALYRAADADNARRIGREDVEKAKLYGITSFGKDMLEVADTLEKGIQAFEKIPEDQMNSNKSLSSICTGVKLSIKVLHKNLAKHGIEKVQTGKGDKFDPNVHDALVRLPITAECPNDTVAEVFKEGYKIKDRVLRAAQVAVASDQS